MGIRDQPEAVMLSWVGEPGHRELRIEIHAETCEECEERVRYWNDEPGSRSGNASCGCCTEGPEACSEVFYRPQVVALLEAALAQIRAAGPTDASILAPDAS